MTTFVLLMVLHPAVLKKAQAEIDRVIGSDRLPDFSDKEALPYLSCIFKEILRYVTDCFLVDQATLIGVLSSWASPVPLAIPHSSMRDDVYREYDIAAGTMILPNVWQVPYPSAPVLCSYLLSTQGYAA